MGVVGVFLTFFRGKRGGGGGGGGAGGGFLQGVFGGGGGWGGGGGAAPFLAMPSSFVSGFVGVVIKGTSSDLTNGSAATSS